MNERIPAERRREEQEKAAAFRQGIAAFKAGEPKESNRYLGKAECLISAWNRGWESEKTIRTVINPRERGVL